jgi:hypothetical protein
MRVIPKLLSEKTSMFRFYSSKFRVEPSKKKTARVVLWREFNIINCFTLEASFYGYFNKNRVTKEFMPDKLEKMGKKLGLALYDYILIKEEDDRDKILK